MAFAISVGQVAWHLVMKDGTVAAMGREAIKDIRSTFNESYFGKGEQHGEPGAPLNPTQGEVAAERRGSVYGSESFPIHRSPSEIIDGKGGVHGQTNSHGHVLTQEGPKAGQTQEQPVQTQDKPPAKAPEWGERADGQTWGEAVGGPKADKAGNAENDQNQRGEKRSLADEQRQRQQEQEHDHGHSM